MIGPKDWYGDTAIAQEYDAARLSRQFFQGWRGILLGISNGTIPRPPLSALFDYMYMRRLIDNASETFTAPHILDIGSGTSYVYRHLLADGWTGRCEGLDVSPAMLQVTRDELARLRASSPPQVVAKGHLFTYVDRLGRPTVSETFPNTHLDLASLDWLDQHLTIGTLETGLKTRYSAITGFAGPLCFFPPKRQTELLGSIMGAASQLVTLQFKNARFSLFDGGPLSSETADVIDAVLDGRISYPVAGLTAWYASRGHSKEGADSVEESHEAGGFSYWRLALPKIGAIFEEHGWHITGVTTMGFMSQAFYPLISERYSAADGPEAARLLSRVRAVDDFFCERLQVGDNLQVTAVARGDLVAKGNAPMVVRGSSFRTAYRPIQ